MNVIVFGAPACGKDTMCNLIKENFDMHIISTGDIIRENINCGSEFGKTLESKISKGNFIADDIVIKMVENKISSLDINDNLLFTGFPRNLNQAKWLCNKIDITHAIELVADYKIIEQRVLNRKICTKCNAVFGADKLSKKVCEHCGGELIVRSDDNKDTLKQRLISFEKETQPLSNFFSMRGLHYLVDAGKSIQEVFKNVKNVLGAKE